MNQLQQFWQHVASDIQTTYQKGHPSNWKQGKINRFLIHFEDRLKERCQENDKLIQGLDLFVKDGEIQFNRLKVPSYDTFRRIFKTKESRGSFYYRNQFSIYLGYNSFDDYALAKGLNELLEGTTDNQQDIEEGEKAQVEQNFEADKVLFIKNALLTNFKWMLLWLTGSVLIHNTFGIIKDETDQLFWYYIFWLPPLLIGLTLYHSGVQLIKKGKDELKLVSIIWWLGVICQIIVNQYIPAYWHVIDPTSIFMIGTVGQISLAGQLVFIARDVDAFTNLKHQFVRLFTFNVNMAMLAYILGIFVGLLLTALIWIVPSAYFEYEDTPLKFRLQRTFETITGIILISIGYWKLIFKPILFLNVNE